MLYSKLTKTQSFLIYPDIFKVNKVNKASHRYKAFIENKLRGREILFLLILDTR